MLGYERDQNLLLCTEFLASLGVFLVDKNYIIPDQEKTKPVGKVL